MGRRFLLLVVLALALAPAAARVGATIVERARVETVRSIYDGDTLTLNDGRRVRLVQIDTPELASGECYSRAARSLLVSLVPVGSRIELVADPALDSVDRYGRLLRYVYRNGANVNLELVRRGAATPYFFDGDRGHYARVLMQAALTAKAAKRGLWGACPHTALDPLEAANTGTSGAPAARRSGSCVPSYPTVCIPPPPPDLDCKDISYRRFEVRWDVPDPDPHHFDGDRDGIGCES